MAGLFFPSFDYGSPIQIGGESRDFGGTKVPYLQELLLSVTGEVRKNDSEISSGYMDGWVLGISISESGRPVFALTKEIMIDQNTKVDLRIGFSQEGIFELNQNPFFRFHTNVALYKTDDSGNINSYDYGFYFSYVPKTGDVFNYTERYNGKAIKRDNTEFKLRDEDEVIPLTSCTFTTLEGAILFVSNHVIAISPSLAEEDLCIGIKLEYNLRNLLTALSSINFVFSSKDRANGEILRLSSELLTKEFGEYFRRSIKVIPQIRAQ